jgi:hypothetical protein
VGGEGRRDVGFFQDFGGGEAFHRAEPPQVRQWDDRGCLAAEMDHFIRLIRARVTSRLRSHNVTVPAPTIDDGGPASHVPGVSPHLQ